MFFFQNGGHHKDSLSVYLHLILWQKCQVISIVWVFASSIGKSRTDCLLFFLHCASPKEILTNVNCCADDWARIDYCPCSTTCVYSAHPWVEKSKIQSLWQNHRSNDWPLSVYHYRNTNTWHLTRRWHYWLIPFHSTRNLHQSYYPCLSFHFISQVLVSFSLLGCCGLFFLYIYSSHQ